MVVISVLLVEENKIEGLLEWVFLLEFDKVFFVVKEGFVVLSSEKIVIFLTFLSISLLNINFFVRDLEVMDRGNGDVKVMM